MVDSSERQRRRHNYLKALDVNARGYRHDDPHNYDKDAEVDVSEVVVVIHTYIAAGFVPSCA